jgi:hypothetical protein
MHVETGNGIADRTWGRGKCGKRYRNKMADKRSATAVICNMTSDNGIIRSSSTLTRRSISSGATK